MSFPANEAWAFGSVVGGAYRLEGPIGKGGFGAVFRGRTLSSNQPVAIKLLNRSAMVRVDGVARFKREAELAMQLKHESTIRVLGSGDAGDGTPYIAFELLEGTSLDQVLAQGPLSQDHAIAIAMALLGSLGEAHALGIVHRDVKPANVFMCAPSGLIKLLDFGVAKSTVSSEAGLTAEGLMVGTPAYMAPEQIAGREVSPPTDLYAVALVVAEVITGRPVYDATPLAICMDKVRGLPRPFDDRIRELSFFEVLERATRAEPSSRYANAQEMKVALVASRAHSVSQARFSPSSIPPRPSGGTKIIEPSDARSDPRPIDAQSMSPEEREVARRTALAALGSTLPINTPRRPGMPTGGSTLGPVSVATPSGRMASTHKADERAAAASGPVSVVTPSGRMASTQKDENRKSVPMPPSGRMASTVKDDGGPAAVVSPLGAANESMGFVFRPTQAGPMPAAPDPAHAQLTQPSTTLRRAEPGVLLAAPPGPKGRTGLVVLLIVLVLLALGGGAFAAWQLRLGPFEKPKPTKKKVAQVILPVSGLSH